jgi:hypothetical protein
MEISVVRKRLTETIERARKQAAARRTRGEQAARDFDVFLQKIAVPLMRQIANALKADGYAFTVFTPSDSVRLMSDRSADDFIELALDPSAETPQVAARISRTRGRRVIDAERAVGAPAEVSEEQLLDFLLREIEAFVER